MKRLCSFLLLAPLCAVTAPDIPEAVGNSGMGVNIHFVTGHERDLDMIAAAFSFVRMDFGWEGIERKKGEYDWKGYEELLRNLERRGLRAIFILDYSNPLYEEAVTSPNPINGVQRKSTASPQHPESIAAFARWAAASAKHFRTHRIVWEIWNEPNIHFWSPEPNAQQYAELALATAKAVREAEPDATIIAPASSGFPWVFLETAFKSGLLEYLDAVSVHPYRDYKRPPETAAADYKKLRELIERYAPESRKSAIRIICGEWGYATHKGGVSLDVQGEFAARQQLSNLLNGIPISIWYDWKNDGPDANEREHNFGTVTSELQPKPAYVALKVLKGELAEYGIEKRISLGSDQDYVLVLRRKALSDDAKGSPMMKLAAWTLGEPHSVTLELEGRGPVRGSTASGEALELKTEAGRLVLELKGVPQYVHLGKRSIK